MRRFLIALPLVLAGWIAVMAAAMLASDAAPLAVAILPGPLFIDRLPADATVVSRGRFYLGVQSDAPGLGRSPYRAGALLVLPSGLIGCLPLPR